MRAMASDDAALIVADADGELHAFSLLSGELLRSQASSHDGVINALDATIDAAHVVTAADDGMRVWNVCV
jgi:hypothetical protein